MRLKRMQSQVSMVSIVPIGAAPTSAASYGNKRPERKLLAEAAIPTGPNRR